jgi:hypothetical protein
MSQNCAVERRGLREAFNTQSRTARCEAESISRPGYRTANSAPDTQSFVHLEMTVIQFSQEQKIPTH